MIELFRRCRLAMRGLALRGFDSALVVVTLAVGIGATAGTFLISHGVLARPLPVTDPQRLVYVVSQRLESGGYFSVRWHEAARWRAAIRGFEELTVFRRGTAHLQGENAPRRIGVAEVTPDYFSVLGVNPELGRVFTAHQVEAEANVAVISHGLWQKRFGGEPGIVGRPIDLDGVPHTIVGVMPRASESQVLGWLDLWVPLRVDEAAALAKPTWGFSVLARLRPEVDLDEARKQLATASVGLATERPEWNEGWGGHLVPVREWMALSVVESLRLLTWAGVLVLLIACVTASNLLYGSTLDRSRELAIRRALGASKGNLFEQMGLECAFLATAAGGLGGLTAEGVAQLAIRRLPDTLLELDALPWGLRTWGTVAVATAGATVFCTLFSATAMRRVGNLGWNRITPASKKIRSGLVVVETALATVALILAMLLVRSLAQVQAVDPGFVTENLLTMRFEVPAEALTEKETRIVAYRQLLDEVEALPGVGSAAVAGLAFPMTGGAGTFQLWVEGRPRGPQPDVVVNAQVTSPGYFTTMGISRQSGLGFEAAETWESHHRLIVNQTFARMYWPGQEAVGRWVEWGNGERGTVAAVVGDVHQAGLEALPSPEVYLAWGTAPRSQTLIVRSSGDREALTETIRKVVAEILPGTPIYDNRTGREIVRSSFATREVSTWALATFASLAQILGLFGLYGVVLHSVVSRRRDFGIRVSLGARRPDLIRLVLRSGLAPVVLGLVAGSAIALAAGRALESQLFGVAPGDPLAFLGTAGLVGLTALIAAAGPARRAAGVDPAQILREGS